eukprot:GEMP01048261.1.p1 GENE.GEMP01048261.1~~GEMP01048261.1.p1  ORF type:complete len:450 (+),score=59.98 GEMP01048261.1:127-1476(+)
MAYRKRSSTGRRTPLHNSHWIDSNRLSLSLEPYVYVEVSLDVVEKICERSVLIKFFIEVWGEGQDLNEAKTSVEGHFPANQRRKYLNPEDSFCYRINTFGHKLSDDERNQRFKDLGTLFRGDEKVDIKKPQTVLWILEDYKLEKASIPSRVFLGRQICAARNVEKTRGDVAYYAKYELNKRCILGPTTLDNELAFLMANMAQVSARSACVLDPFCGTGGILLSITHFQPQVCIGNDIDLRVLKGWRVAYTKNKEAAKKVNAGREDGQKDIFTNFLQYELPTPEIVVSDNARPCWRQAPFLDAIVTDPPYGIRAAAKKARQKTEHDVKDRDTYCPQRVEYEEKDILKDMLEFASQHLRDGGRLVYLLAVDLAQIKEGNMGAASSKRELVMGCGEKETKEWWAETTRDPLLLDESRYLLPEHPDLEPIGASLQILSGGLGRLLVTMRRRSR